MKVDLITRDEFERIKVLLESIDLRLQSIEGSGKNLNGNWLKGREVCEILKCSSSTLSNYRVKGVLHYKRMGGTIYYDAKSLNGIDHEKGNGPK